MTWLQRYRFRQFFLNSTWVFPVLAMVLATIILRLFHGLDELLGWEAGYDPETTRTVLSTFAGAMFTFIVFVCSALLLVVQLASANLSPRIIGVLFKDPITKVALSVFVFSFTFVLSALVRIGTFVPLLTTQIAAYSCAASVGVFLYLVDHVSKVLRSGGALRSVASQAHQVIEAIYPRRFSEGSETSLLPTRFSSQEPARTITNLKDGVVLAFDVPGLVQLAAGSDCVIELVPQVGDFVASGEPLFRILGSAELPASSLRQSIALGEERTLEQDPAFALRVIVDIASKGLSPAINDPTTAVLAIDQIHHLLRSLGNRCLDDERVCDAQGRVRLIYRTPGWGDFLTLAVTEIRHFGGLSIQVARRLRAMLENLIQTLPEPRVGPLRQELELLHRSAERFFTEPEDRVLAEISDSQGVGGKREPPSPHG